MECVRGQVHVPGFEIRIDDDGRVGMRIRAQGVVLEHVLVATSVKRPGLAGIEEGLLNGGFWGRDGMYPERHMGLGIGTVFRFDESAQRIIEKKGDGYIGDLEPDAIFQAVSLQDNGFSLRHRCCS